MSPNRPPPKLWFTASELADKPGLPSTPQGVNKKAKTERWEKRKRAGRGGGWEYPLWALPGEFRGQYHAALARERLDAKVEEQRRDIEAGRGEVAETVANADTGGLKDWQRQQMEARLVILRHLETLEREVGGFNRAIKAFKDDAKLGDLPPHVASAIPLAYGKDSKKTTIAMRTVKSWKANLKKGLAKVAPKPRDKVGVPDWLGPFLNCYRRPGKPPMTEALATMLVKYPEFADNPPGYHQVRNWVVNKLGTIERNRGRYGARELKNFRGYVIRDFSDLLPGDVYAADGHKFDAEVKHPENGSPCRPEITIIIDVATRRIVGWSIDLNESAEAVLDALRHAIETNGIPAIFYTDGGSGYINAKLQDPMTGFLARFGITHKKALPYNSQARGVVERVHQTILVKAARQLPTYLNAAMDPEARNRAFKVTRKELKEKGKARYLIDWQTLYAAIDKAVIDYNAGQRRALPRVTDATGRKRHMSADEYWSQAVERGATLYRLSNEEKQDLFRPEVKRKCLRSQVQWLGNTYYAAELEEWHGETVRVAYDIHDGGRVWVKCLEGRLIAEARFEANKQRFFPVSETDKAREIRNKSAQARLDDKMDKKRREARTPLTLAAPEGGYTDEQLQEADAVFKTLSEPKPLPAPPSPADPDARPLFIDDVAWARWMADHPDRATEADWNLMKQRLRESSFRTLLEINGIDRNALKRTA